MIRQPDTRAHRRAFASLAAYRQDTRPLSRNRHSDALAGHLAAMVGENVKLRADLLATRERLTIEGNKWNDLKLWIAAND